MNRAQKVETVTFRIDSVLKTAFAEIAAEEAEPVANCCASWFASELSRKRAAGSRRKRSARHSKQRPPRRIRAATRPP
jgi:hypothetical protein